MRHERPGTYTRTYGGIDYQSTSAEVTLESINANGIVIDANDLGPDWVQHTTDELLKPVSQEEYTS